MTDLLATLVAQGTGSGSGSGSAFSFALLPLILAALYFLMVRPQRKRQREIQQLQSSIGVGDEVMTSSGIYGFITGEEDDLFWLEIDDDVQIRIAKAAIHSRVPEPDDGTSKPTTKTLGGGAAEVATTDTDDTDTDDTGDEDGES